MSHYPEPISIFKAVSYLPDEIKNLDPARETVCELGGDTNDPVWQRLEQAVTELNAAADEAALLMESLHDEIEALRHEEY